MIKWCAKLRCAVLNCAYVLLFIQFVDFGDNLLICY